MFSLGRCMEDVVDTMLFPFPPPWPASNTSDGMAYRGKAATKEECADHCGNSSCYGYTYFPDDGSAIFDVPAANASKRYIQNGEDGDIYWRKNGLDCPNLWSCWRMAPKYMVRHDILPIGLYTRAR